MTWIIEGMPKGPGRIYQTNCYPPKQCPKISEYGYIMKYRR